MQPSPYQSRHTQVNGVWRIIELIPLLHKAACLPRTSRGIFDASREPQLHIFANKSHPSWLYRVTAQTMPSDSYCALHTCHCGHLRILTRSPLLLGIIICCTSNAYANTSLKIFAAFWDSFIVSGTLQIGFRAHIRQTISYDKKYVCKSNASQ